MEGNTGVPGGQGWNGAKPRWAKSEAKMEWLRWAKMEWLRWAKMEWLRWAKMECRQWRAEQEIHSPEKELPERR